MAARKNTRIRTRKLVPWYHENKPQCEVETGKGRQCANSASYESKDGYRLPACKIHRDILTLLKGTKFQLIRPSRINIDTQDIT